MSSCKRALKPWIFVFPAASIYLAVVLIPSLNTLVLSLFKWNGASPKMTFVGWDNYIRLFTEDTVFILALINTLLWTIASVIFLTALSLSLALLLNQQIAGRLVYRSIFYFPSILSAIVAAITWRWMYHPQGLLNSFLGLFGIRPPAWLADPHTAMGSVFIASLWFGLGQPLVLFLAGLQTVAREPYEAAIIDGAGPSQRFFSITLPLLRETMIVVLATVFINGMRVYDLIFAMTGGGPAESTQVLSSWMYFQTFAFGNFGVGAAISWVLIIISMMVIVPYVRFTTNRSEQ